MDDRTNSFGYWLRRRRKALDLTQDALAGRVSCSGFSIRKIEADERRPSRRLAERLAVALAVPETERQAFLDAARAVHSSQHLRMEALPSAADLSPAPAQPPAAQAGADAYHPPFVGRSSEFNTLTELMAQLASGTGHTVLIEGEPGIGKSRLLDEVTSHARAHGILTLATKCYEIESATPYQPVIDLITRVLDTLPDASLRQLPPVALAELAALVPEIGERVPGLPQLSDDFPEARQARRPRSVDQLFEAWRGGRPSLLVVDDLQWADDASAQVIQFLARRAAERPVLVICTCRDEDIDSNERLARLVDSLRRERHVRHLPLARLGAADAGRLVAALAGGNPATPAMAERLFRETDGNPFFLTSILQSLGAGETALEAGPAGGPGWLPDALRAAVRVRLAHVPKAVRPVLETAAVLGRRVDFDTLLEVTRAPEAELLDALETLAKRHLLREEPEGGVYDFNHDKVREVVYRDIGGARRRLLHQAVAEALESHLDAGTHERDTVLAEHYERAQVWSKALQHLVLAGERSQSLFAMRDALHWLDRAVALAELHPDSLDAPRRHALYRLRGGARAQAGQTQGAVADIRRVVEAARAAGEREQTRDALVQLGMAYRRADAYEDATACLTEALTESLALHDERHAADTLYHLGTVAWSNGLNHEATGFHQRAVEICDRMGFAGLVAVQAHHGRGEAHYANAEAKAAVASFTRSLELARQIGDKGYESENLMMIGHACVGSRGLGDYPRALAHFEAALDIARAADLQWHLGPTLLGADHARACTGRYGEAWTGMVQTLQWLESLGQVRYQLIAHDFMGHLLLDLGMNQQALEHMERALALSQRSGIGFLRAGIEAHAAVARSRLGQTGGAPALQALLEQTRRTSERYMTLICLDALAEIALVAGDTARCRACADELLALGEAHSLREIQALGHRWRGEAALADRASAQAESELALAAAQAHAIGRVRLERDAEAALARLAKARGQREAARQHQARARTIAKDMESSLAGSGLEAATPALTSGSAPPVAPT